MASKLWILFQRNKSFTDYLASFTQLFFTSFLWFWSLWERCDWSQVLLIFISERLKLKEIILFTIYTSMLLLYNSNFLSFWIVLRFCHKHVLSSVTFNSAPKLKFLMAIWCFFSSKILLAGQGSGLCWHVWILESIELTSIDIIITYPIFIILR